VDENALREMISAEIPSLLEELSLPYDASNLILNIEYFDNVEEGLKLSYSFQINFNKDDNSFVIDVNLWRPFADYLITQKRLRAVLAHELCHYYEFQTSPEHFLFLPATLFGSTDKYKDFMEFVFDDWRDCVVNMFMPEEYLKDYQEFFFLSNGIMMHYFISHQPIQSIINVLENKDRIMLKWGIMPIPHFLMTLNTLRGTQYGEMLSEAYRAEIKKKDKDGMMIALHDSIKQRFIKIYDQIKMESMVRSNLETNYHVSSLLIDAMKLPIMQVEMELILRDGFVKKEKSSKSQDRKALHEIRREMARKSHKNTRK